MTAVATRQLTTLADWKQEPALARAQRDFLAVTRDANERILKEVLSAVGVGRDSLLRLELTNDELGAFARLANLVDTGWQDGSELLAEKLLPPRQVFATAADIFVPPPAAFLDLYRRRELRLAGVYEADRLSWVQNVISGSQLKGISPAEMQETIGRRFPGWTDARLHNIARTESALLYEHGRVGRMQSSEFVQGYTFVAVIDGRTTDICGSHDGNIYSKADAPVPPLHFQCRSNLEPIFVGEEFDLKDPTQRELDSPPLRGFGGGPEIPIVQPAMVPPVPAAYVPQATVDDALAWAQKRYPNIEFGLAGIREKDVAVQIHNTVIGEIDRMILRYPAIEQRLRRVSMEKLTGAFEKAGGFSLRGEPTVTWPLATWRIRINSRYLLAWKQREELASWVANARKTRWHPAGRKTVSPLQTIIDHETGHVIRGESSTTARLLFDNWAVRWADNAGDISEYAKMNKVEMFAEAITAIETTAPAIWPEPVKDLYHILRNEGVLIE